MTTREMERILSLHIQQRSTSFLLISDVDLGRLVQYPFSIKRIDRSLKLSVWPTRADRHHPFPSRGVLHRNVCEQITCRRVMDSVWSYLPCTVSGSLTSRPTKRRPRTTVCKVSKVLCRCSSRVSGDTCKNVWELIEQSWATENGKRCTAAIELWNKKRETASEWIPATKEVSAARLLHWMSIPIYTHHLK